MVRNLHLAKIFWSIPAACALTAALAGILSKDLYAGVFAPEFLPGAFAQDLLTVVVCICLLILIAGTKEGDMRKQVVILGLIGSLFYLYGILTMERVYNWCYLLYAAVFASAFWSIIYSLGGFQPGKLVSLTIGKGVLRASAISSIVIALSFTALWCLALVPLMRDHIRIEYLYSIYILDLCFVMPAFFMTALMSLRGHPFGVLMMPAIMVLGFFVIFPLGLNELAKPSWGMTINYGAMAFSFAFALYMLVLAVLHLRAIHIQE